MFLDNSLTKYKIHDQTETNPIWIWDSAKTLIYDTSELQKLGQISLQMQNPEKYDSKPQVEASFKKEQPSFFRKSGF